MCMPSFWQVQPHYSKTKAQVKYQIWYNRSLDGDPISHLLWNPSRPCNLVLNEMTGNKQHCVCVTLQLLFGIWDLQIPQVPILILWATNYVLSIYHWKSHKNTEVLVCMTFVISSENPPNNSIISERKKRLSGISPRAHTRQGICDTA